MARLHTRLLTPAHTQGRVLCFPLGKESLTELPAPPLPPSRALCPPGGHAPRPSRPCGHQSSQAPVSLDGPARPGATALSVVSALLGKRRPLWKSPDPSQRPAQRPSGTSPGLATASHGALGQQRGCFGHSRLIGPKYQPDMPWSGGSSWDNAAFQPTKRLCG